MTTGTKSYEVRGMSCEHCVVSVREEIAELGDVELVDLDLESGRLTVAGPGAEEARIAGAVEEAGYELAGAPA
jgi:copper chaperone CopZ